MNTHPNPPLISLDDVTTRIRDRFILKHTTWTIEKGQSWAVIGPNGSGKTSLTRVLVRELPVVFGTMKFNPGFEPSRDIALVSFESQKRLMLSESRKDEARIYSGKPLDFTSVSDFIGPFPDEDQPVIDITGIRPLLHRNVTRLSTGEFRKVLITRALLAHPVLLILDEPLEGLDEKARIQVRDLVDRLIGQGIQVVMVTHRVALLPSRIDQIIGIRDNAVFAKGNRDAMLDPGFLKTLYGVRDQALLSPDQQKELFAFTPDALGTEMVCMEKVSVRYGDMGVFQNLSWIVKKGEKWMVRGPNGSGKTTLLSLIAGDHPQAYANAIYLFGKRRGTGESIWDIKKRIGLVSSEFQLRYQRELTLTDVILSGFFDSVGLYKRPLPRHKAIAQTWLSIIGFETKADTLFTHLSFGEQKRVLIARAMVKSPDLLILDEPCQGLDPENRRQVLSLIDALGQLPETTLIYVTHHQDETLPCVNKVLDLVPPAAGF